MFFCFRLAFWMSVGLVALYVHGLLRFDAGAVPRLAVAHATMTDVVEGAATVCAARPAGCARDAARLASLVDAASRAGFIADRSPAPRRARAAAGRNREAGAEQRAGRGDLEADASVVSR